MAVGDLLCQDSDSRVRAPLGYIQYAIASTDIVVFSFHCRTNMAMAEDVERIRMLLANTVGVLCRNSVNYNRELKIQGLIGVTLDSDQVFLVSINEMFNSSDPDHIEKDSVTCHLLS